MNRRWYSYARGLQNIDVRDLPGHPAPSTAYALAQIATLPRVMGERLDELHAPLRIAQFVAYARGAPDVPRELVRQTRFRAVLSFWEGAARWPDVWHIRKLRWQVEEQLGLRTQEPEEPEEAKPEDAGPEAGTCAPIIGFADIQAALDGKNPALLRRLEQFAQLRRQTR